MPHNFHDRDPSRKSVSGVRINLREPRKEGEKEEDLKVKRAENLSGQKEGKERVEYFGGRYSDALKLSKASLQCSFYFVPISPRQPTGGVDSTQSKPLQALISRPPPLLGLAKIDPHTNVLHRTKSRPT